ncbi:hypothetical protein B566_EDAN002288 [Ephemera danica]|nr:hypothetical protein B566_EDAN002288 [Ephemera danica]
MFQRVTNLAPICAQQVRGMATLKSISIRLKSVKNIQKITQSMKMVSAAKYTRAERELRQARPIGVGAKTFYERAEVAAEEEKPQRLIIAVTSDRGLCGAVHTSVSRAIRNELAEGTDNVKVVCVGRKPPTFQDAARVAQEVLNSGYEFSSGKIVYNRFKSVVSYTTTELPLFSLSAITNAPKLSVYDSLDAEVIQSYLEFSIASLLFYAMKEGACSEQSSRMTAMGNASKNAGEMIDKLTLTFNRTRQSVITRELIEIISGAAALTKE